MEKQNEKNDIDELKESSRRLKLTSQELEIIECWMDAWTESDDMALPMNCSYQMAFKLRAKLLKK